MAKKLIESTYLILKRVKESPVVVKTVIGLSFVFGIGGVTIGILNAQSLKNAHQKVNKLSNLLKELGDSTLHMYYRLSKGEDVMDVLSKEMDILLEEFGEKKEKEES